MNQLRLKLKAPSPSTVSRCEMCQAPRRLVFWGMCASCCGKVADALRSRNAAIPADPRPLACRYATCTHKRCMVRRIKALRNRLKGIADVAMEERDITRIFSGYYEKSEAEN